MTAATGDRVRVMITVDVPIAEAFRVFTEEIDAWWRRGRRFRHDRADRGVIRLEPGVGGRLFEEFARGRRTIVVETGKVTTWEPPRRLAFEWRIANFAPGEVTYVEVDFVERGPRTEVTVVHRGWAAIRPDHPARHGEPPPRFLRTMGLWWGDLLGSLRARATTPASGATTR